MGHIRWIETEKSKISIFQINSSLVIAIQMCTLYCRLLLHWSFLKYQWFLMKNLNFHFFLQVLNNKSFPWNGKAKFWTTKKNDGLTLTFLWDLLPVWNPNGYEEAIQSNLHFSFFAIFHFFSKETFALFPWESRNEKKEIQFKLVLKRYPKDRTTLKLIFPFVKLNCLSY